MPSPALDRVVIDCTEPNLWDSTRHWPRKACWSTLDSARCQLPRRQSDAVCCDHRGCEEPLHGAAKRAASTIAWANALGASWGRLCPTPPVRLRCAYLPENLFAYAKRFSGKYAHRNLTGGVGHNLPQEAPSAFAQAIVDAARFAAPCRGSSQPRWSQQTASLCRRGNWQRALSKVDQHAFLGQCLVESHRFGSVQSMTTRSNAGDGIWATAIPACHSSAIPRRTSRCQRAI